MPSSPPLNAATTHPRRVVIKLGTGVLTSGVGQLDENRIAQVCSEIAALRVILRHQFVGHPSLRGAAPGQRSHYNSVRERQGSHLERLE